jgi:hypothetical protein
MDGGLCGHAISLIDTWKLRILKGLGFGGGESVPVEEGEGLAKDILKANNTIKLVKGREDKLKKEVETLKKSVDSKNQETAELHKKIEILSSSEKRFKGIRL